MSRDSVHVAELDVGNASGVATRRKSGGARVRGLKPTCNSRVSLRDRAQAYSGASIFLGRGRGDGVRRALRAPSNLQTSPTESGGFASLGTGTPNPGGVKICIGSRWRSRHHDRTLARSFGAWCVTGGFLKKKKFKMDFELPTREDCALPLSKALDIWDRVAYFWCLRGFCWVGAAWLLYGRMGRFLLREGLRCPCGRRIRGR